MPRLTETLDAGLGQLFIYGSGGTRKTTWACSVAEAGYNVLLINGDAPPSVLKQLSAKARERIYVLDVHDRGDRAVFAKFMAAFCNAKNPGRCFFDEETGRVGPSPFGGATDVNVTEWGQESVIVVDHYSLLTSSCAFQYASDNHIDVTLAEKDEWPGYGWQGRFLTVILEQLRKLPCHIVVIGHETMYEKYEGTGRERRLVFQRTQPRSSSNPHGMAIADKFQEVYIFNKVGTRNMIDMDGNDYKDAQSKVYEPKRYEMEKLPLSAVLSKIGAPKPPADLLPIDFSVIPKRNVMGAKKSSAPPAAPVAASSSTATTIGDQSNVNAKRTQPASAEVPVVESPLTPVVPIEPTPSTASLKGLLKPKGNT